MKSLNIIALQQNLKLGNSDAQKAEVTQSYTVSQQLAPEQFRELVELAKRYRQLEEAYLDKVKRQEFNRDEKHHMMKCRQKLDYLLTTINL